LRTKTPFSFHEPAHDALDLPLHNAALERREVVVRQRVQRDLRVEVVASVSRIRSVTALERVRDEVLAAGDDHGLPGRVDARWVLRHGGALQTLDKVRGVCARVRATRSSRLG
jgi:transposase InsO family protein